MTWFLERVSIEGFRGINNVGDPLELSFDPEKVNSVSAPNGVGKSSIFEAVTYALTGGIPKLDDLSATEKAGSYYLNRFHPSNLGTVSLSLKPAAGGASVRITVTRNQNGTRTVATNDGSDGEEILSALNREFVLLDAKTFRSFIDDTPLNRGRSFSGLLGLGSYSNLRQALQGLANTQAFNNQFEINSKTGKAELLETQIAQARENIHASYLALVSQEPGEASNEEIRSKACATLLDIPTIASKCEGKSLDEISPDECLECVREAEGGKDRERLATLLQKQTGWEEAIGALPTDTFVDELVELARERDKALQDTQGDLLLRLYKLTEQITDQDDWSDKNVCPACERNGDTSVLEHARSKIALYNAVTSASNKLAEKAAAIDWDRLVAAEREALVDAETPLVGASKEALAAGSFDEGSAVKLRTRVVTIRQRSADALDATVAEKEVLEATLPDSLVAITEKVEATRRLQAALSSDETTNLALNSLRQELTRIDQIKTFLTDASKLFAVAEAEASARRLAAIEPLCRQFFQEIVFEPVVPAIKKRVGAEDMLISLASFHSLQDVSAQSLLPESYRNAFAISVYLAAASLYGGAARFLLLDDVTSSLDAGHQFHLMEVIRTRFSRPETADGPQVIILSHDTLLEKYFNTNGSTPGWSHQRIEGSPRTAVLPQSSAVNRVRDTTLTLLNAGNVQDAAPRIRQYLEYVLEQIIIRCRIPVPMDIALSDDKRMAGYLLGAIDAQVKLHSNAHSLILEASQTQGLNLAVASITANFLSHWSTGQTQALCAGALLGVMQAIDNYADCFKFEPNPGTGRRYYRSLSQQ